MAEDSKDKKTTSGKKDSWRHDPEYIRYVESGESAAVLVVRDVVQAVNTSGKRVEKLRLLMSEKGLDLLVLLVN